MTTPSVDPCPMSTNYCDGAKSPGDISNVGGTEQWEPTTIRFYHSLKEEKKTNGGYRLVSNIVDLDRLAVYHSGLRAEPIATQLDRIAGTSLKCQTSVFQISICAGRQQLWKPTIIMMHHAAGATASGAVRKPMFALASTREATKNYRT
jgi:hypothetical protein